MPKVGFSTPDESGIGNDETQNLSPWQHFPEPAMAIRRRKRNPEKP